MLIKTNLLACVVVCNVFREGAGSYRGPYCRQDLLRMARRNSWRSRHWIRTSHRCMLSLFVSHSPSLSFYLLVSLPFLCVFAFLCVCFSLLKFNVLSALSIWWQSETAPHVCLVATFCTCWPCNLDLWPFDLILIFGRGTVNDYPCAEFGDFCFSRFGFIVRTDSAHRL